MSSVAATQSNTVPPAPQNPPAASGCCNGLTTWLSSKYNATVLTIGNNTPVVGSYYKKLGTQPDQGIVWKVAKLAMVLFSSPVFVSIACLTGLVKWGANCLCGKVTAGAPQNPNAPPAAQEKVEEEKKSPKA